MPEVFDVRKILHDVRRDFRAQFFFHPLAEPLEIEAACINVSRDFYKIIVIDLERFQAERISHYGNQRGHKIRARAKRHAVFIHIDSRSEKKIAVPVHDFY